MAPKQPEIVVVVTGKHKEFHEYMHTVMGKSKTLPKTWTVMMPYSFTIDGTKYIRINSLDKFMGVRPKEVVFFGSYHTLPDYEEIFQRTRILHGVEGTKCALLEGQKK